MGGVGSGEDVRFEGRERRAWIAMYWCGGQALSSLFVRRGSLRLEGGREGEKGEDVPLQPTLYERNR